MKMILITLILSITNIITIAQSTDSSFAETPVVLNTETGDLHGTLTLPKKQTTKTVALIIAGSGPTDRNGNSMLTHNNALRMLAHGLANQGIASLRYDKRGIVQSAKAMKKEADLRFEDYIHDAMGWIELLKKDQRFSSVAVIGHSEGSLIGMVAVEKTGAQQFVSIAGPGKSIDETLKEQIQSNAELYDLAAPRIDSMKQGLPVVSVDNRFFGFMRPSVQPYMTSWMKYNPRDEIKKLKINVLIVQGTKDLQVPVSDAQALATPRSRIVTIENMNHVLKIVEGDEKANAASYRDPDLPLAPELVEVITTYIKSGA